MDPHSVLNVYYETFGNGVPRRVLNRMVDKAMVRRSACQDLDPPLLRPVSLQPQCFAPHVDITRAKCAFDRLALPKLRRELHSDDPLIVRQAISTIADLVMDPEKLAEAIKLHIPDRLADLLKSDDSFLRERTAMIYTSMARQSIGRDAILKNPLIVYILSEGLKDHLDLVRIKIAKTIEMLSSYWIAAESLCIYGFVDLIVDCITYEKDSILIMHLDTLQFLLDRDVKVHAIEIGTMDKLVELLKRKDEEILVRSLACLAILCQEPMAKQKAIDVDLLLTLKTMLDDKRRLIHVKASSVIAFLTMTTPGKLRALELQIMDRLIELATDCHSRELQIMTMKALTNIAETPGGRIIMKEAYLKFIENIETCGDKTTKKHKDILLEIIQWRP